MVAFFAALVALLLWQDRLTVLLWSIPLVVAWLAWTL